MLRIGLVLLLSLVAGSALVLLQGVLPVRPGYLGVALMLVSAMAVRRHWRNLDADSEPGSPERELWHCLATTALIAGHLVSSLWLAGPGMTLHSVAVHAMAIDNWTLVLGALLSFRIARDPEPRSDERDTLFAARSVRAAYATLIGELCMVILILGFGAELGLPVLSLPLVAHVLIVCLMVASMVRCAVQLAAYARARRALQAGE
jgi:hypothetical protein